MKFHHFSVMNNETTAFNKDKIISIASSSDGDKSHQNSFKSWGFLPDSDEQIETLMLLLVNRHVSPMTKKERILILKSTEVRSQNELEYFFKSKMSWFMWDLPYTPSNAVSFKSQTFLQKHKWQKWFITKSRTSAKQESNKTSPPGSSQALLVLKCDDIILHWCERKRYQNNPSHTHTHTRAPALHGHVSILRCEGLIGSLDADKIHYMIFTSPLSHSSAPANQKTTTRVCDQSAEEKENVKACVKWADVQVYQS